MSEKLYQISIIERKEKLYLGYAGVWTAHESLARQMTEAVAMGKLRNIRSIGKHDKSKTHYKDAQLEPVQEVVEVAV